MLTLETWIENYLATQPEYRMGYQKVVAKLSSGGSEKGIIVNSTIFLKEGEIPWELSISWDYALKEAKKSQIIVKDVTLIPREPETLKGVRQVAVINEKNTVLANRTANEATRSYGVAKDQLLMESQQYAFSAKSAAAQNAPITLTAAGEIFKRFCAYANDRRLTPGRGLTPGTFATTKEDADANIKTGTDAVKRYALPDSKPASNVFTVTPVKDTDVKRGTAQPANNQTGGGVEVIFVNGLPDGTVSAPVIIPDK